MGMPRGYPGVPRNESVDWKHRFLLKVDRRADDECWPWLGAVQKKTGYGVFGRGPGSKTLSAHVVAIEYATGDLPPKGTHVDHVKKNGCTRRDCVNWVSHLEVVTPKVNAQRAVQDSCPRGHLRADHSYTRPNGQRLCRPCATQKQREWRDKKKGQADGGQH